MATVEKKCTKARLPYASKSQVEIRPLPFLGGRKLVKGHESKKEQAVGLSECYHYHEWGNRWEKGTLAHRSNITR